MCCGVTSKTAASNPTPDLPESCVWTVTDDQAGRRLDLLVTEVCPQLTRSQGKRLIESGDVQVDGEPGKPALQPKAGQVIEVAIPAPVPLTLEPEPIPLDIVYEDADLLVVNKAAGMVTHPSRGHWSGTLVHALLAHCDDLSGIGGAIRPGIVHRLDKDTTGLLVVAKHDEAHQGLQAQLRERTAGREYLALVHGDPAFDETTIDAALGRHPTQKEKIAVREDGKPARTTLFCQARYGLAAELLCRLHSGRTHQVRVHCNYLGHPLLGDKVYGTKRRAAYGPLPEPVAAAVAQLPGQALHAWRIRFLHPSDGREMTFEVSPPAEFEAVRAALREMSCGAQQQ